MLYIRNWQQSATFWKIIVSRMQNLSCLYYAVAKYDMITNQNIYIMDFNTLLQKFESFEQMAKNGTAPFRFNVLDLQQGHIVENSHSNILMQLLQYRDRGCFVFFQSLMDRLHIEVPSTGEFTFEREKSCGGGRIDGLIYERDNFAVVIENKVNGASDGNNQLGKYLNAIKNDKDIFTNSKNNVASMVWVIYLTRDGSDPTDNESIKTMVELGICNNRVDDAPLNGARYAAASYRNHILPWLEEDVYPMIKNMDVELSSGVMQYICYLKGENFFNINMNPIDDAVEWFNKELPAYANEVERNKALHELYLDGDTKRVDGGNTKLGNRLLNVIQAFSEKPMKTFLDVTTNYFGNSDVWHHFTFYYICMRPKMQPDDVKVVFSWDLLGIKRLTSSEAQDYTFSITVSGSEDARKRFVARHGLRLCLLGYKIEEKITRKLVFRCNVPVDTDLLNKQPEEQRKFLEDSYKRLAPHSLINDLVHGVGACTLNYEKENIPIDWIKDYHKAIAAIYEQGRDKYGLRLLSGVDGIALTTPKGEVTLEPSKNNVGRLVLELNGLNDEQRAMLEQQKIAQEWFLQTPDYRTPNGVHKVTAFGIWVERNIHVPEEETLRKTVENTFKVLDCLLRK